MKFDIWKYEIWDLKYEVLKLKIENQNLKSKNLKYDKNNHIDIIELYNVVKFENWMYKIENKVSELGNFEIWTINTEKLKNWKLKTKKMKNWNSENWKLKI